VPANLTPPYHDAEERFKAATTHEERLEAMREMIALLPKHKGTEKLYADLKKRLAKLETEVEHAAHGGRRPDPGHVKREGAGQWVLLGEPNAGSRRSSRRSRTRTRRSGSTRSRPASPIPG
jgi:Predicted GTPase